MITEPLTPECEAYVAVVQSVLDRESAVELLHDPHCLSCSRCGELQRSALELQRWQAEPVQVPARFTEQVCLALNREAAKQWRLRWAMRLTAVFLIIGGVSWPLWNSHKPVTVEKAKPLPAIELPESRFENGISEVGTAIVTATRNATDQSLKPAQNLFTWPESFNASSNQPVPLADAGETLYNVPQAAKAGFDPVASGTKRAVNRLLRDLSAITPSKPKS